MDDVGFASKLPGRCIKKDRIRCEFRKLKHFSNSKDAFIIYKDKNCNVLSLDYDEGPYYQTQRFDRYKSVIRQLVEQGDAYYCECSRERLDALRERQMADKQKPRYDGCCRELGLRPREGVPMVVRFRNPQQGVVSFTDHVKGEVKVANSELDDLIIERSDGSPTYNLSVIVDAKSIPGDAWELLAGTRVMVINALWYGNPHPAHFSVEEALEVIAEVGPERAVLTHLTHRLDHDALAAGLPPGVEPAYDGLVVEI